MPPENAEPVPPAAAKTLVAKLARNGRELRFCYEAGPCGYGIQRQLTVLEHDALWSLHR